MDIKEIQNLIKFVQKSGVEEVKIERDDFKITIKTKSVAPQHCIAKGDVLCVIEAMKLFNEIESDFSGKIVKILVDDQSPVEFDQPLFIIDPS